MRDLAEKWSVAPEWQSAVITAPGLAVRSRAGLDQLMVSGDLDAWAKVSGLEGAVVGAFAARGATAMRRGWRVTGCSPYRARRLPSLPAGTRKASR